VAETIYYGRVGGDDYDSKKLRKIGGRRQQEEFAQWMAVESKEIPSVSEPSAGACTGEKVPTRTRQSKAHRIAPHLTAFFEAKRLAYRKRHASREHEPISYCVCLPAALNLAAGKTASRWHPRSWQWRQINAPRFSIFRTILRTTTRGNGPSSSKHPTGRRSHPFCNSGEYRRSRRRCEPGSERLILGDSPHQENVVKNGSGIGRAGENAGCSRTRPLIPTGWKGIRDRAMLHCATGVDYASPK